MTKKNYLTLLLFYCPILNLLCGVSIDLYAPSLVEISHDMGASITMVQNSITLTIIGYAVGQLLFGIVSEAVGIRKSLFSSLLLFLIASIAVVFSKSIFVLMLCRLIQGLASGSFAVNARALLVNNFKGRQLNIAVLYLSIVYGIGPIMSPYFGGLIAEHFGWPATFVTLAAYALGLILVTVTIRDIKTTSHGFSNYLVLGQKAVEA